MGLFNLFTSNKNTEVDFNSFEYLEEESNRRMDPFVTIGDSEDILNFPEESRRYRAMRDDYLELKDIFKSDREKLKMIMKDWTDYCECLSEMIHSKNLLSVNDESGDGDNAYLNSQEIEKRVVKLLGDESEIGRIINKHY